MRSRLKDGSNAGQLHALTRQKKLKALNFWSYLMAIHRFPSQWASNVKLELIGHWKIWIQT